MKYNIFIFFRVLNDRTQAVGCLKEGEISLLIYRRLASFTEEKEEDLLEKKIKLKHYLLFNDPDYFPPLYKYLLKDLERPLLKFSGISETENFQKKKFKF